MSQEDVSASTLENQPSTLAHWEAIDDVLTQKM